MTVPEPAPPAACPASDTAEQPDLDHLVFDVRRCHSAVQVTVFGPRHGERGQARLTPQAARRLAAALVAEADAIKAEDGQAGDSP
jgi:hypothetical protein